MSGLLEVRGLRSGYQGGVVLDGVDLDLAEGSVLAVLGRNGVGQDDAGLHPDGAAPAVRRAASGSPGRRSPVRLTDRIARRGVGLVPQGRRVFAPLTRGGAPGDRLPRRGRGAWDQRPGARAAPPAGGADWGTAATSSPAVSSRCWRSHGPCSPTPGCCCSTSRRTAWRRPSWRRSARSCARCGTTGCRCSSSSRTCGWRSRWPSTSPSCQGWRRGAMHDRGVPLPAGPRALAARRRMSRPHAGVAFS